jgi:hypothetical protein
MDFTIRLQLVDNPVDLIHKSTHVSIKAIFVDNDRPVNRLRNGTLAKTWSRSTFGLRMEKTPAALTGNGLSRRCPRRPCRKWGSHSANVIYIEAMCL